MDQAGKRAARRKVASAMRSGKLARPYGCCCNGCPLHDGPCLNSLDNGHRPEAHHPDHSLPLDVVYLCNPCHKVADDRTQMTPAVVDQATRLRRSGLSLAYTAKRLGVSIRTLRRHVA